MPALVTDSSNPTTEGTTDMDKRLSNDDRLDLEKLTDRYGLSSVLTAVANLCADKGEHVESNWQDGPLAIAWYQASATIEELASRIVIRQVSE